MSRAVRAPRSAAEFARLTSRQQERYQQSLRVVRRMRREHVSLAAASRAEKTSSRTVIRYTQPALEQLEGSWYARSRDRLYRRRYVPIRSDFGWDAVPVSITDSRTASTLGKYWRALQDALAGEPTELQKFKGRSVTIQGRRYPLLTDTRVIEDLAEAGVLDFDADEEVGS
ncbi:MAG: hypothetical protein WA724_09715 [Candidatus Dormiibacterota bacterium]